VDFVHGRASFYANYQTVLGEEKRIFDPNQGNYILGAVASGRLSRVEISGGIHHESRHMSDRIKVDAIDWNMLGVSVGTEVSRGRAGLTTRGDVRRVILKSFVDYTWEVAGQLRGSYAVHPRMAVIGGGHLRLVGTDGSRGRGTQTGVRAEGGVRLVGTGAALELFLAGERRVDPYPLEFGSASWFSAGFRLVSP
jgi:hypothetical protein